jgi:hypothetical protein
VPDEQPKTAKFFGNVAKSADHERQCLTIANAVSRQRSVSRRRSRHKSVKNRAPVQRRRISEQSGGKTGENNINLILRLRITVEER